MTRSIKKNKQFLEVEALKYSVVERRKGRDLVGQAACTLHESPRAKGFQEPLPMLGWAFQGYTCFGVIVVPCK